MPTKVTIPKTGRQTVESTSEEGPSSVVFSDKTGTLTCNIMKFRNICVSGINYGDD